MRPSLTICVVNYQGYDVLPATFAAIRGQLPPALDVVLVDNASTDGSVAYVREYFPEIRIIELATNRGPGLAREAGLLAARTDLVGFVDNDVAPNPDCFHLLAAALRLDDGAALAMPRVVHADQPGTVQFEGARAHFIGLMALEDAEQPVQGRRLRRARSARSSPPAFWSTAAAGVTRACRTQTSLSTRRTTTLGFAPGSWATASFPSHRRSVVTARAPPGCRCARAMATRPGA